MKRITTNWLRCCAVLVIIGANSANAQSAQVIAKKAFGSTVLLVMEDANGQPLSLGSGFFVGAGEIASNLHVVEGAVRGYAKLVGQKNGDSRPRRRRRATSKTSRNGVSTPKSIS